MADMQTASVAWWLQALLQWAPPAHRAGWPASTHGNANCANRRQGATWHYRPGVRNRRNQGSGQFSI